MSKYPDSPLPPLPAKRKPLSVEKARSSRQDWEKYINQIIRDNVKTEHRLNNPGYLELFDMTGDMMARRKRVLLDTLPQIKNRYPDCQSIDSNTVEKRWIDLNAAYISYGAAGHPRFRRT